MIKIKFGKKGQFNPVSLVALLLAVPWWMLLGAIFLLFIFVGMFWWKLGTILGISLIITAVILKMKGADWKTTAFVLGLGLFSLINPFGIVKLQMMW